MIMSEGDNMEITYRKASLKDLYNILSFCRELKEEKAKMSFCDVDNTSEIQSWIDNSNMYLFIAVDEVNNIIAGMFLAKRGLNNKRHSVYISAAVNKQYRNHGVATTITNTSLEEIKKDGVIIARTKIYSWNELSIKTIKKCGFIESGKSFMHEYHEDHGGYVDDLIFHKII